MFCFIDEAEKKEERMWFCQAEETISMLLFYLMKVPLTSIIYFFKEFYEAWVN